ncbi:S-methyl-5-thioribose kinase [Pseudotabrizicola sediminis]|uniref:S-methyl-5-thioribose kinase n=1 Tax=Pseudotabrizicola sediminis TaxID=2486418 RepID=A0ABY2KHK5_9RHOB|nr:S-methyl-5-thioribose kinase [Pseudotabrizicola sediminis]TGD41767.1 S-methyl-5-thioribose kinase [Pseudotabrizicola sediminis]
MIAYTPCTTESLRARLANVPAVTERLGTDSSVWDVREVGDGNLNLVFIVQSLQGALVVKQALPYVRLVGDSWPLPLKRSVFEYNALIRHALRDPGRVPEIYHFDEVQALVVMRYLSPHVILRKSIVTGVQHPNLAADMGLFLARTLFRGSNLSLPAPQAKADLALFSDNVALADITENLVFSDPYFDAAMNRHTPGLDPWITKLRTDRDMKVAAQAMKHAFVSKSETLVHGDLHSGSIMVTAEDTQVIDPEFAIYGPFGFDIGMLLANFLLGYFAQSGHEATPGDRAAYRSWLLSVTRDTWGVFVAEFSRLWRTERTGILYQRALFEDQGDPLASEQALQDVLRGIWVDAMGFCGVEMHRRVLGLAHVEDLESITDDSRRLIAERRALALGRHVTINRAIITMEGLIALAERIEEEDLA